MKKILILIFIFTFILIGCRAEIRVDEVDQVLPIEEPLPIEVIEPPTPTIQVAEQTPIYSVPPAAFCDLIFELSQARYPEITFELDMNASFMDWISGETGLGCQIIGLTDGTVVENHMTVLSDLITNVALGFTELPLYQADGPTGSASVLYRDMALLQITTEWAPSEADLCSPEEPISSCELKPEQKIFTLQLILSEYSPGFSLDGYWEDTDTGLFTLELYQEWKILYGSHVSIAQDGEKIDSIEASINGMVNGHIAMIEFVSSFSNDPGQAQLTFQEDGTLLWQILDPPPVEHYLPEDAILERKMRP